MIYNPQNGIIQISKTVESIGSILTLTLPYSFFWHFLVEITNSILNIYERNHRIGVYMYLDFKVPANSTVFDHVSISNTDFKKWRIAELCSCEGVFIKIIFVPNPNLNPNPNPNTNAWP